LQKFSKIIRPHIQSELDLEIIKTLDKLYINVRYPGDLGLLPEDKPTLTAAQEFYQFAKDIYQQVEHALT